MQLHACLKLNTLTQILRILESCRLMYIETVSKIYLLNYCYFGLALFTGQQVKTTCKNISLSSKSAVFSVERTEIPSTTGMHYRSVLILTLKGFYTGSISEYDDKMLWEQRTSRSHNYLIFSFLSRSITSMRRFHVTEITNPIRRDRIFEYSRNHRYSICCAGVKVCCNALPARLTNQLYNFHCYTIYLNSLFIIVTCG